MNELENPVLSCYNESMTLTQTRASADTISRTDLLLVVLAASDGQPYNPAPLQKTAFLATENLPALGVSISGEGYDFEPYHYGPFDVQVYKDVRTMQKEGTALIASVPNSLMKVYQATPMGVEQGTQIMERMPADAADYIRRVSGWARNVSFAGLLRAVYAEYPHMAANSVFAQT